MSAEASVRTPLFFAQHSDRYDRQRLIAVYEEKYECNLIVLIDQIFLHGVTVLEDCLTGLDPSKNLHVLLSTPGGDGEVAIRLVRSMQARCNELVMIVPDMAKSAGTIMCLGADKILMGPASDLGPKSNVELARKRRTRQEAA